MKIPFKTIVSFCIILISAEIVTADVVTLNNGEIYNGLIIFADENYVYLEKEDKTKLKIPQSRIQSVFFSVADIVRLNSGEAIKCKILDEIFPHLVITSANGILEIPINSIKDYFYGEYDSLNVTKISKTGSSFKNEWQKKVIEMGHSYFVASAVGLQWNKSGDWKKEIISAESLAGLSGDLRGGYFLTPSVTVGGGINYTVYLTSIENFRDANIKNFMLYLSTEYFTEWQILFASHFVFGLDAGVVFTGGEAYRYSYRKIELSETAFALNPRLGLFTSITPEIFLQLDAGYLFAKSRDITDNANIAKKFSLSFNGFRAAIQLRYHFKSFSLFGW